MRKISYLIIPVLLCIHLNAQSNEQSKDDGKFLTIAQLIKCDQADLPALDSFLTEKKFILSGSEPETDIISYKYVLYNFFSFKKYIASQKVIFKMGYTEGLYKAYLGEISSLKLVPGKSVLIKDGYMSNYTDQQKKWNINFAKITSSASGATELIITITTI
jgi:hypothetical protein